MRRGIPGAHIMFKWQNGGGKNIQIEQMKKKKKNMDTGWYFIQLLASYQTHFTAWIHICHGFSLQIIPKLWTIYYFIKNLQTTVFFFFSNSSTSAKIFDPILASHQIDGKQKWILVLTSIGKNISRFVTHQWSLLYSCFYAEIERNIYGTGRMTNLNGFLVHSLLIDRLP